MTPGHKAYADDVRKAPLYHDGSPRPSWLHLSAEVRQSWENHPYQRLGFQGAVGVFYPLPMTVEEMVTARAKWDTDRAFAPLCCAQGVIAWGTPLPCNYRVAA